MTNTVDEVINNRINQIKENKNIQGIGRVIQVKSYILEVSGLENISYFEYVNIGNKAFGYVDSIRRNTVMIALVKIFSPIKIGDVVKSTGKMFEVAFSEGSIGHVIDMFGEDKFTGSKFEDLVQFPVESVNTTIMDRTSVNRSLYTGITGIDMLYPIGKGQRQLIIGDKKTGKTQVALDTIVSQKNANVLCIYCALGKTKKEVRQVYEDLQKHGAMKYTIIISAFNDECAPVLQNTPYAAVSIADFCMHKYNTDVLVIIDDLKRHADACREIALLSGKVPGRDAYPTDIFYIHARLLEKGCQHKNGGSITILPICETKGGDITDFISTNIISITDGQIVLSAKNFEKGQKPAINYGLSVSRLGGAVQIKDAKRIGTKARQDLLEYLEQRDIYDLANTDEMSQELKDKLAKGKYLLNSLLQYKFDIKKIEEMIAMLDVKKDVNSV